MRQWHPWLTVVHTHMLHTKEKMTAREAIRFFGEARNANGRKLIHAACRNGHFTFVWETYEGTDGPCTRARFTAVVKPKQTEPQTQPRVCSVWHLGEALCSQA